MARLQVSVRVRVRVRVRVGVGVGVRVSVRVRVRVGLNPNPNPNLQWPYEQPISTTLSPDSTCSRASRRKPCVSSTTTAVGSGQSLYAGASRPSGSVSSAAHSKI